MRENGSEGQSRGDKLMSVFPRLCGSEIIVALRSVCPTCPPDALALSLLRLPRHSHGPVSSGSMSDCMSYSTDFCGVAIVFRPDVLPVWIHSYCSYVPEF